MASSSWLVCLHLKLRKIMTRNKETCMVVAVNERARPYVQNLCSSKCKCQTNLIAYLCSQKLWRKKDIFLGEDKNMHSYYIARIRTHSLSKEICAVFVLYLVRSAINIDRWQETNWIMRIDRLFSKLNHSHDTTSRHGVGKRNTLAS